MTPAERQRRRRERLGIGGAWLPARRPWDNAKSINRRETETIDAIENWLAHGDINTVTKWLSHHLESRDIAELNKVINTLRAIVSPYE